MQSQTNRSNSSNRSSSTASVNPFARALAEAEKQASQGGSQSKQPFGSDLLGSNGVDPLSPFGGADFDKNALIWEQQMKAKKERERKRLHDEINPVDSTKLFDARQEQVKEEINKLRYELQALSKDVAAFNKEIELTLMTEIGTKPGQEGKYFITFFQQLRSFIMLLRQKIKSAKTWASTTKGKSSKKKRMQGAGIVIEGSSHEQTKSVFDMMHHERSNAYGG